MTKFSSLLLAHKHLQDRIQHSEEFLDEVREAVTTLKSGSLDEICIFAAGSLGRFETGRRSDLDVFFLSHRELRRGEGRSVTRLQEIEVFADLIRLNEKLALPPFSGDGRFLKIHEVDDLINATGDSSRDDNENLFTARLLLLLESKPLSNDLLYQTTLKRVLNHYFRDGKGRRDFQPLFLLNDVLRYWRTLCLNYERDRTAQKQWWKKNLNLKFSRKLTVFSTVLAIVAEQVATTTGFMAFAQRVPLQRLANTLDDIGDTSLVKPFANLLDDYESFLAAKSHAELDARNTGLIGEFRQKAEVFGDFFHLALQSSRLKRSLVRYVLI
jgi:hypothetical protein